MEKNYDIIKLYIQAVWLIPPLSFAACVFLKTYV